ncbi:AraC family transcriptional regulator [Arenibaculum sp.]|jgi:AraC-like DNA-binding protein|uniref:AraC family transcriptional regulator n=1 Tax=Arenibaculum sp. TaxID=2865862 RepID=UPI002E0E9361|nr:AraC family transcriptional regulator [Arenibaculum sp.]
MARGEPSARDWLSFRRDPETGIESIRAHSTGHAYDPHDHDDFLVGITERGVQEFQCRGHVHISTPGRVILIEPGEPHDGNSPSEAGFTYAMLYLPRNLLAARSDELRELGGPTAPLGFRHTLADDSRLAEAVRSAFLALHGGEGRLARDLGIQGLAERLRGHVLPGRTGRGKVDAVAARARDVLHAHFPEDIGLEELASLSGVDRFRLNRVFGAAFGVSPHAYLVRLRLKAARRLLAKGETPAAVAAEVGFADQSHLGRWFRRAYGMTPAAYRSGRTNVPD